jgi:hypothetical protein
MLRWRSAASLSKRSALKRANPAAFSATAAAAGELLRLCFRCSNRHGGRTVQSQQRR